MKHTPRGTEWRLAIRPRGTWCRRGMGRRGTARRPSTARPCSTESCRPDKSSRPSTQRARAPRRRRRTKSRPGRRPARRGRGSGSNFCIVKKGGQRTRKGGAERERARERGTREQKQSENGLKPAVPAGRPPPGRRLDIDLYILKCRLITKTETIVSHKATTRNSWTKSVKSVPYTCFGGMA